MRLDDATRRVRKGGCVLAELSLLQYEVVHFVERFLLKAGKDILLTCKATKKQQCSKSTKKDRYDALEIHTEIAWHFFPHVGRIGSEQLDDNDRTFL